MVIIPFSSKNKRAEKICRLPAPRFNVLRAAGLPCDCASPCYARTPCSPAFVVGLSAPISGVTVTDGLGRSSGFSPGRAVWRGASSAGACGSEDRSRILLPAKIDKLLFAAFRAF